uniref:Uncharacterized protein n=1 Tax=Romanomermis culicivorax TaxID=13658 RepID=A0A915JSF5_ROMCU
MSRMAFLCFSLFLFYFGVFRIDCSTKFSLFENFVVNDDDSKLSGKDHGPSRSCAMCLGEGVNDCQGQKTDGCEYCTKILGTLIDSSQMPDYVWKFLQKLKPDVEDMVIRMCTNSQIMEAVNLHDPKVGCHQVDRYGFQGRACLCNGECIYPKSAKVPLKNRRI